MNPQLPIAELFTKYLENRCSREEILQLLAYFKNAASEDELRTLIQAELIKDRTEDDAEKTDAVIVKVREALQEKIKKDQSRNSRNYGRWLAIAAIWIIFTGSIGFLVIRLIKESTEEKLLTVLTRRGERRIVTLSDGSKIWLSPSSKFTFPIQFKNNFRDVKLEGEAYFEVAKDKKHPFIIHSGEIDTRVVGTSFTIRSDKGQNQSDVTVVTGIVKVSVLAGQHAASENVVLKPNQRAVFNRTAGILTRTSFPDAAAMLKRKDGILTYNGTPIREVLRDFSRYYNLSIQPGQGSGHCLCFGEFDMNRPADITLSQLAAAINGKVVRQNDTYFITGGCEE